MGILFFDESKESLENVWDELKGYGYQVEKFEFVDTDEWMLYVSKIDILTADKLHKRNIAFNELAEYYDVKLYDGWDVEKI